MESVNKATVLFTPSWNIQQMQYKLLFLCINHGLFEMHSYSAFQIEYLQRIEFKFVPFHYSLIFSIFQ